MKTIRPIRSRLKEMREEEVIDKHTYRRFYRQSKGGMFKSKAHLESHMKAEGVLKQPKE